PIALMGRLTELILSRSHLGVGVPDLAEVRRTRSRTELGEEAISPIPLVCLRHGAFRIGEIAEDDRTGCTSLLAGGHDAAVFERLTGALALDLGFLDALHAVVALLHDAAHADRDVRVVVHLLNLGHVDVHAAARVVVEEVEATNLVWAVVRAVAR